MDNQLQNKPWHERLEAHALALQLMSATGNEELFYRGLKTLLLEVHAFHEASAAAIHSDAAQAPANLIDRLKYFLSAWGMNGVGSTVAKVQDSPDTIATLTVNDLSTLLSVIEPDAPIAPAVGASLNGWKFHRHGTGWMAVEPKGRCHVAFDRPECEETERVLARLCAILAAPTPTVAADAAAPSPLLTADHKGMRVDYSGLLRSARHALAMAGDTGIAEMLRQLKEHLTELGQRWYAGDTAVVDELLQLYCVEKDARDALVAAVGDAQS